MPRYIKVSDIQAKIRILTSDIRACKNTKVKKQLEDEQASYIVTLRTFEQHFVAMKTANINPLTGQQRTPCSCHKGFKEDCGCP